MSPAKGSRAADSGQAQEPGSEDRFARVPRLGGLLDRAQEGVLGIWNQVGAGPLGRAEAELRELWVRLMGLPELHMAELERLREELRQGVRSHWSQVGSRIESLSRVRAVVASMGTLRTFETLRKRLVALEFRIRSLEQRQDRFAARAEQEAPHPSGGRGNEARLQDDPPKAGPMP